MDDREEERKRKRKSVLTRHAEADEFNRKFIFAVKLEPVLYDFRLPEYSAKESQEIAWIRIAEEFGETGLYTQEALIILKCFYIANNNYKCLFSVQSCKDRWKNLRAGLTRHIKLKRMELTEGHCMRARKPYYLIPELKFLIPFTRVRKPENFEVSLSPKFNELNEVLQIDDDYQETDHETMMKHEEVEMYAVEEQEEGEVVLEESTIDGEIEQYTLCKPRKHRKLQLPLQSAQVVLQRPSTETSGTPEENLDTPEWHFFKSIMPDVLQMNPQQNLKFRLQILNVINDILQE